LAQATQSSASVRLQARLDADLIATPVRFGLGFKRPTKKVLLHQAGRAETVHG
jgi:hypothetical protein